MNEKAFWVNWLRDCTHLKTNMYYLNLWKLERNITLIINYKANKRERGQEYFNIQIKITSFNFKTLTYKHGNYSFFLWGIFYIGINIFPVRLRIRLLSSGLKSVLSYTGKLCITLYYRKFSTNLNKNHKTNTSSVSPGFRGSPNWI